MEQRTPLNKAGKGVVCRIAEDKDMPVDVNGNRADVAIFGISTIKRMNMGRIHEQFLTAARRDTTQRLRAEMGLDRFYPDAQAVNAIVNDPVKVEYLFNEIMGFYKIVSPIMYDYLQNADRASHVLCVLMEDMYIYFPPDNPINNLDVIREILHSKYAPTYQPVTFKDSTGQVHTTKHPVLIGELYMILLEKTTDEWSSAASVRQQHLGIPAKLNNSDKYSTYGRSQAVRGSGEAENRNQQANAGVDAVREIMDQSNNPQTHREVVLGIITSNQPSNIDKIIDRTKIPYGNSRPSMLARNVLNCMGVRFTYVGTKGGNK